MKINRINEEFKKIYEAKSSIELLKDGLGDELYTIIEDLSNKGFKKFILIDDYDYGEVECSTVSELSTLEDYYVNTGYSEVEGFGIGNDNEPYCYGNKLVFADFEGKGIYEYMKMGFGDIDYVDSERELKGTISLILNTKSNVDGKEITLKDYLLQNYKGNKLIKELE